MKKQAFLGFKDGKYFFQYTLDRYTERVTWSDLVYRIFGGCWGYDQDKKILTIHFRYGNVEIAKDYDFEYDPADIVWMSYNVTFNKNVINLFEKLQKDYLEFLKEVEAMEFEREIFCIEY